MKDNNEGDSNMTDNKTNEFNQASMLFEVPRRSFFYNLFLESPRYILIWGLSVSFITIAGVLKNMILVSIIINLLISLLIFWRLVVLTRYCLKRIEFNNKSILINISKYNKQLDPIKLDIEQTRIQIHDLVFPVFKNGRNFKLVITSLDKQLKRYKVIHTQHEFGNWDLDLFKEIYKTYGFVKKVRVNTDLYKRLGF